MKQQGKDINTSGTPKRKAYFDCFSLALATYPQRELLERYARPIGPCKWGIMGRSVGRNSGIQILGLTPLHRVSTPPVSVSWSRPSFLENGEYDVCVFFSMRIWLCFKKRRTQLKCKKFFGLICLPALTCTTVFSMKVRNE